MSTHDAFSSLPAPEAPAPGGTVETVPAAYPGLAAMAVQQSTSGPLGPPTARRLIPLAVGGSLAAGLALSTAMPVALAADPAPAVPAQVAAAPAQVPHKPQASPTPALNREIAALRLEHQKEMEQLRQDLFGAVMGVSALKDRLEHLEASHAAAVTAVPEGISFESLTPELNRWLDERLETHAATVVQHTLETALGEVVASLKSTEFFRMPVHASGLNTAIILSQAPQILSISLS